MGAGSMLIPTVRKLISSQGQTVSPHLSYVPEVIKVEFSDRVGPALHHDHGSQLQSARDPHSKVLGKHVTRKCGRHQNHLGGEGRGGEGRGGEGRREGTGHFSFKSYSACPVHVP